MKTEITLNDVVAERFGYKGTGNHQAHSVGAIEIHNLISQESLSGADVQLITQVMPVSIVADAIGTTTSNIGKVYARKKLKQTQVSQIVDMSETYSKVRDFFEYDAELVEEFLSTPTPSLNGVSPYSLMSEIAGRDAVEAVLAKMAFGDLS